MINEQRVKIYCKDDISKIENYEKAIADTTQTWSVHHRLELTLDDEYAHSAQELQRLDMYYQRPYFELIFLTNAEHKRLHAKGANPMYGKHHSKESRKKISEALKGRKRIFTAEHRQKLSESLKGKHLADETRRKLSVTLKGRTFTSEHRQKISESAKARWARRNSLNQQMPIDEII